jgi:4-hydroxybenzoate polyprenyltransferase
MVHILTLIRPHQWIKNFFILAPLFFSFAFTYSNAYNAILGFVLFSIIASGIYVLNDYMDIEEDKHHPTKKNRPLASGKVSKPQAVLLMFLLIGR